MGQMGFHTRKLSILQKSKCPEISGVVKRRLAIFKISLLVALNYLCFLSCALPVAPRPALLGNRPGSWGRSPWSWGGLWAPHSSKSAAPPAVRCKGLFRCGAPRRALICSRGLLRMKKPCTPWPGRPPRGPRRRASRALTSHPGLNWTTYLEKERENGEYTEKSHSSTVLKITTLHFKQFIA